MYLWFNERRNQCNRILSDMFAYFFTISNFRVKINGVSGYGCRRKSLEMTCMLLPYLADFAIAIQKLPPEVHLPAKGKCHSHLIKSQREQKKYVLKVEVVMLAWLNICLNNANCHHAQLPYSMLPSLFTTKYLQEQLGAQDTFLLWKTKFLWALVYFVRTCALPMGTYIVLSTWGCSPWRPAAVVKGGWTFT